MMITSVALCAVIATSGTLALLIDQTMSLVNTFVPPEITAETTVELNIQKNIATTSVNEVNASGFTFELWDLQNGKCYTATSDNDGAAAFTLPYTEADIGKTFKYTLKERNDAREGFTYDTRVYEIEVTVKLKGNDLVAAMVMDQRPVDQLNAEFINTYFAEGEDVPPPPAGDSAEPVLYGMLMIISFFSLLLIWRLHRKHS
jgi:pilin isopeptide linkage protein